MGCTPAELEAVSGLKLIIKTQLQFIIVAFMFREYLIRISLVRCSRILLWAALFHLRFQAFTPNMVCAKTIEIQSERRIGKFMAFIITIEFDSFLAFLLPMRSAGSVKQTAASEAES